MKSDARCTIISMFNVIDSCQWEKLSEHFHPDIQYLRPGYDTIFGLADLIDFYENRRIIKHGRHIVENVCTGPDEEVVSVVGSFTGFDRRGKQLAVRFCDVYHLSDEKIKNRETFFNAPSV